MDNTLYEYSAIVDRPKLAWPQGARVAFYAGLNIEHFEVDKPSTSIWEGTSALVPDPLNHGWRDYGNRVGIWRLIEIFDRHGVRPSILLNADAADRYPQIVDAGNARDWAWLAHGKNNSNLLTGIDEARERALLTEIVETLERVTGTRPRGWLGPGLSETFNTPRLLHELGLDYVLDWTADDQPFPLAGAPGMWSVPYTVELNDLGMFLSRGMTGPEYAQAVKDAYDQLYEDASDGSGRVLALALHPFVIGHPTRAKYLAEAIAYVAGHPGSWVTTSDEIAAHAQQANQDATASPTGTGIAAR
jgi:peptidoglycan/xylan/chitin deacetylase (PgdA/CDA1 family)